MYYKLDKEILDLIKNGKLEEALSALSEIMVDDARVASYLNIRKARLAVNLKKYFLADFYLLLAKETADKSSDQYFQILSEEAKLALECHDYERVFSCCKEVVRSGRSHDGIIYLTLGHAYEQLGNYSKSLENYKIAFAQTKSNNVKRASLFSLATLEYSVGHFAKSEQYVNSYIEMSGLNDKILHLLACCYFRQSKYQELELLLSQVKENYPHLSYDPELDILLAKGLRKKFPRIKKRSYSTQQLIHYQKNVAIEHISKNHRGDKSQKTSFAKDIDIEKLYEDVQIQLSDDNIGYTELRDVYDIPYPNIGYDADGNILNRIRVITIPGTKNIIAMYPANFSLLKEKKASYLSDTGKQMTRIERFNARLAKKNE